jgi:hypothetical protein
MPSTMLLPVMGDASTHFLGLVEWREVRLCHLVAQGNPSEPSLVATRSPATTSAGGRPAECGSSPRPGGGGGPIPETGHAG